MGKLLLAHFGCILAHCAALATSFCIILCIYIHYAYLFVRHHYARWFIWSLLYYAGADPGFSFGGGAKDYVPARTLRARNRTRFRQGSRAHLRALEALSRVVLRLSRAFWALFLSILILKNTKRNIVDPVLLGAPLAPPLDPPLLCIIFFMIIVFSFVFDVCTLKKLQKLIELNWKDWESPLSVYRKKHWPIDK